MRREARIAETQRVLADLNFDQERCNRRSALVLLALLDLKPTAQWRQASAPLLRVVAIMDWLAEHYGQVYAPNTRETIRRFTLHQFVDAGLVLHNPDDPLRAVNSPRNCYQVDSRALRVFRAVGGRRYNTELRSYLAELPGLRAMYERAREQDLIPVTLPDGSPVELTPGGQNVLLKQMVEDFCARWTPGGHILYIGDAGREDPVFEEAMLRELGVSLDKHGKLPDLIVYLEDRNWLVLMEAASTHGPVDAKRRGELEGLFGTASAGLVYVSCFPTREEYRRYATQLAWETEVWCADNPTHLIHYNGERFLGPYPTDVA